MGGIGEPVRIRKHPSSITEYDGTGWRLSEKETFFYSNGQKAHECYGQGYTRHIDPCCYDKRNHYWDKLGKEIDQNTYCEDGWGKDWQKHFFEDEARAGRRNVENHLENMKRNGLLTDEQAKEIIRDMENAGTLAPK